MRKQQLIDFLAKAKRVATPIVAINCADQTEIIEMISKIQDFDDMLLLVWDCVSELSVLKNPSKSTVVQDFALDEDWIPFSVLLHRARLACAKTPMVLIIQNGLTLIQGSQEACLTNCQAVYNLRNTFKQSSSMLILLGKNESLPSLLSDDIILLDLDLPAEDELCSLIEEVDSNLISAYKAQTGKDRKEITNEDKIKIANIISGLSMFAAEQILFLSATASGFNLSDLWERKCKIIEQTKLGVYKGKETFDSIKGLNGIKSFLSRLIKGKRPFNAVVFADEIEKMVAGSEGALADNTGVSQNILQALLTYFEDHKFKGILLFGQPGTGKSLTAKALGNEAGVPTIIWDSTAMKHAEVGATGRFVTQALKVISAISNDNAFWIATCNSPENIPEALKARFKYGTYFYDLPSNEDNQSIFEYYCDIYNIDKSQPKPNISNWTGREIETLCEMADNLDCSLITAANYIVPIYKSLNEEITARRKLALNRYIDAATGELFTYSEKQATSIRTVSLSKGNGNASK